MQLADAVNACFEFGGALFLCLNVRRLRRDRTLRGVSVWPAAFWSLWGYWNVYYYSAVGHPLSWAGGVCVVAVNTAWAAMAFRILGRERAVVARLHALYDAVDRLDRQMLLYSSTRGSDQLLESARRRKDAYESEAKKLESTYPCARDAAVVRSSGGCLPAG